MMTITRTMPMTCRAADAYRQNTRQRQRQEAETLAKLTNWLLTEIESKIDWLDGPSDPIPWWRRLWPR